MYNKRKNAIIYSIIFCWSLASGSWCYSITTSTLNVHMKKKLILGLKEIGWKKMLTADLGLKLCRTPGQTVQMWLLWLIAKNITFHNVSCAFVCVHTVCVQTISALITCFVAITYILTNSILNLIPLHLFFMTWCLCDTLKTHTCCFYFLIK